jgi:hypothetical protein
MFRKWSKHVKSILKVSHKTYFVIIPIQNTVAINQKENKMSDNKSKKKTKKKSTKKTLRKKTDKKQKMTSKTAVVDKKETPIVDVKQIPVQDSNTKNAEYATVDSVTLERLKAKFINVTGYPIRVMCDKKWAHIEPDPSNVARVLYSVALSSKVEGIDVYSHGVNAITGLPAPQEGKLYLVLPEVRFLLPERSDLLTHGELIYDGETNKPLGFKNLFCSTDNAKNLVDDVRVEHLNQS